jgi:hypothetical protein
MALRYVRRLHNIQVTMPALRDITHPRFGTYAVDKPFTHNGRTWRIIGRDEDGYILRNEETGLRKRITEQQLKQAEQ